MVAAILLPPFSRRATSRPGSQRPQTGFARCRVAPSLAATRLPPSQPTHRTFAVSGNAARGPNEPRCDQYRADVSGVPTNRRPSALTNYVTARHVGPYRLHLLSTCGSRDRAKLPACRAARPPADHPPSRAPTRERRTISVAGPPGTTHSRTAGRNLRSDPLMVRSPTRLSAQTGEAERIHVRTGRGSRPRPSVAGSRRRGSATAIDQEPSAVTAEGILAGRVRVRLACRPPTEAGRRPDRGPSAHRVRRPNGQARRSSRDSTPRADGRLPTP